MDKKQAQEVDAELAELAASFLAEIEAADRENATLPDGGIRLALTFPPLPDDEDQVVEFFSSPTRDPRGRGARSEKRPAPYLM